MDMSAPIRFALVILCTGAQLWGGGGISLPVIAYVHDPHSAALRPVQGVPGAALVGTVTGPGFGVATAAIAAQNFAIVLRSDTGEVAVATLPGSNSIPIAGARPYPSRMVISDQGQAAVLVYDGLLQIVTGLPGNPVIQRELYARLPSPAGPMAVTDDGQLVLAAGKRTLRLFDGDAPRELSVFGPVQAVAFRAQSHDAIVGAPDGVTILNAVDTGGAIETFDALPALAGLAFLDSGRFIAASSNGTIAVYDRATHAVQASSCGCVPVGLYRSNTTAFRITDSLDAPLIFADAAQTPPAVFFVPRMAQ
jgi:hypothetical protein